MWQGQTAIVGEWQDRGDGGSNKGSVCGPIHAIAICMGCEPKFTNDAFTFKETVMEMWQCLDKAKTEVKKITEEQHKAALASARAPMFASKSSDIAVVMPEGVDSVDPAKYRAFLGVKEDQWEKVVMVSTGIPAQPPQGSAATKVTYVPVTHATAKGDTNADCDPTRLCKVLGMMNKSRAPRRWLFHLLP